MELTARFEGYTTNSQPETVIEADVALAGQLDENSSTD
jgi:hypothetical protein